MSEVLRHRTTRKMDVIRLPLSQESRVVHGLRSVDPCALGRDLQLSAMDAPLFLPAGSMICWEMYGRHIVIMERCVARSDA